MRNIGVIGGGTMGAGIAQVAVMSGESVRLLEIDPAIGLRAISGIERRLQRLVEKGRLRTGQVADQLGRLTVADSAAGLADCELVIEAVIEDVGVKVDILRRVLDHVGPDTVLASNTSSLSITALGRHIEAGHRTCGMHFFNPAPIMPLVEVVGGTETAPSAVDRVYDAARAWGKTAVRVKDTPGFIVNRVARPFYLEALRLVEEGQADCATLDDLLKRAGGFRMGPFELMDLIGIDVNYAVSRSVYEQSECPARLKPSAIQKQLVEQDHLGRKSGAGFYRYEGDRALPALQLALRPQQPPAAVLQAWDGLAAAAGLELEVRQGCMFARIVCALMERAALAAEQGVASDADIDLAMQKGTNYPRGLLAWAASWGHARVGAFLRALQDTVDDGRFAPLAPLPVSGEGCMANALLENA